MRVEERILGIECGDRIDIGGQPRARPYVRPPLRCNPRVYFATSIARDSRMTMTFT
jgi:hypothetical protein